MKTFLHRNIKLIGKSMRCAAALAAFLLIGAAPRALADDDDCQQRIAKADHKLHQAGEHHGWNSSQAEHARHELAEAREHCYSKYHKWWDEDTHSWHTDHDWNEHDHDEHH